jgi:hypothetical protein
MNNTAVYHWPHEKTSVQLAAHRDCPQNHNLQAMAALSDIKNVEWRQNDNLSHCHFYFFILLAHKMGPASGS